MKKTAAISLASIGIAAAFVGPRQGSPSSSLLAKSKSAQSASQSRRDRAYVSRDVPDVRDVVSVGNRSPMPMSEGEPAANPRSSRPRMSQALPFAKSPKTLDGTMAGDAGFDPLGFADSFENLANYREAEIKHARLAMLAAAGWPLSELWDGGIAGLLGMDPALNDDGRVPSVLNGGMGKVSVTYWLGCVAFAAAVDVYGSYFADKKKAGYVPGDLGFDPLGFYPRGVSAKDVKDRENLRLAEIKHGRLAMLAITVFAFQEFITHVPVVEQSSVFFRPIWDVLGEQQPQYYIPPEVVSETISETVSTGAGGVSDVVSSVTVEATAVAPEVAAPAVEAAAAAPEFLPPAAVESAATAAPAVEAAPSAAAVAENLDAAKARIADLEELYAAKARIVELEDKLARIDALTR